MVKRGFIFFLMASFLSLGWAQIVIQSGRVYEVSGDGRGYTDLGSVGDYYKEKESDSENKDSPETDIPQNGPDIDSIRKQNEEDVESFIEETEFVVSDSETDEASEIINECKKEDIETEQKENEAKKEEQSNQAEQKKQEKKEKAETGGDPVILSTGEYIQSDIDFSLKNNFDVERFYNSGNQITGLFGYGWTSVFDERLILCRYVDAEELFLQHKKLLDIYKVSYEEIPFKIKKSYGVSSLNRETAIKELDEKINYLKKSKEHGQIAYEKARVLAVTFGKTEYEKKVQERLNKINERIDYYEAARSAINEKISFWESLPEKIIREEKSCLEYEIQINENKRREKENEPSLYKGTPDYWLNLSGLKILYIDKKNTPHRFTESSDSLWLPDWEYEKRFAELIKNDNDEYELKETNGNIKTFYTNGLLKSIKDRNGNYTEIERDDNGKIFKIWNNYEECFRFILKNGFIISIVNERDSSMKTEYLIKDEKLESVKDLENDCVNLFYDSDKKLVKLQKPDGAEIKFIPGEQTPDGKFLFTETINEEGFSEYFYYDLPSYKAVYVDHDGNKTEYMFDSDYHTIYKREPDGFESRFEYDVAGNLITEIYNNEKIQNIYDEKGNCIQKNYPDGSNESFLYNEFGQIIFYSDRDSVITTIDFDERGNITAVNKDNKNVFIQENDINGNMVLKKYNGFPFISEERFYDVNGNLILQKIGKKETSYEYDVRGRVISVSENGKKNIWVNYENHKKTIENASGLRSVLEYNNRKDLIRITKEDIYTGEKYISEFEYDNRHLLSKKYDVIDGNRILVEEKSYSPEGRLVLNKKYGEKGECLVTEYTVE